MKITKHAQSCFLIETMSARILIDPGEYVFGKEGLKADDFQDIDVVLITHEHYDHLDMENLKIIIKNNHPQIFSTHKVLEMISSEIPGRYEEEIPESIKIEKYASKHGPLPNGNEPPPVTGFVIDDGETRFYTPGDTIFLNEKAKADIIAVPICGKVVMDIKKAKEELLKAKPKLAIPIHYDNPMFPVKIDDFAKEMEGTGILVKILNYGDTIVSENI